MFRQLVGWFCFAAGCVFLAINSVILFRGAAKWASEDVEFYAFGIAAGLVPWVIAVMPALVTETWKPFFWKVKRPSTGTLTVIVVWCSFIGYNIVGGSGAIGFNRQQKVARLEHGADILASIKEQKASKLKELEGVPQHRPAETIERETDALRTAKVYQKSKECADPRTKDQRDNCQAILRLEGELAAATAAARINADLVTLNGQLAAADPASSSGSTDPQADLIHEATGIDRAKIITWLPASTPVILEIGAATMWHFAFSLLGFGLAAAPKPQKQPVEPQTPTALIPSPEVMRRQPETTLEALTAQRKLCDWFFSHCARPVAGGALAEIDWWEHYAAVCKRSGDTPLEIDTFRRIASRYIPRIEDLDGQTVYLEWLPRIPEEAT